jgi:hypothetical protein
MVTRPSQVPYVEVVIDARRVKDWESLHEVLVEAFGFPEFCGHNMNAWIDCMTSLDAPSDGMSKVQAPQGGVVVLRVEHAVDLSARCPEQYVGIVQCVPFVNWRRIEAGEGPILALSFSL